MTFQVRTAAGGDLEAIVAIERAAFTDPWTRDAFAGYIEGAGARVAVAADARDAVLGYSVLMLAGEDADLANLAVAPAARGLGVGRALIGDVLAAARASGVARLFLEVRESNGRAITLYEAAGFRTVGRRRRYYRDPVEDARILRLDLGVGNSQ